MKRLAIDDIPRDGPLRRPVYHEGGLLLFDKGEEVTARLVDLLRVAGVSHVFHFDKLLDNPDKFLERQSRREVPTASVTLGDVSAAPLFDREGRLLVNAGQEITAKVLANLLKARVEKTWVNKTDDERGLPQLDRFRELRRLYADPATDISALLPPPETPAPTPAGAGAPRTAERAPAPSPAPAAAIATPPTPEAVKKTRDTSRLTVTGGQRHITDRMRAAAAAEPEGEAAEGQRALFRRLFEDSYVTVRAILRDVERGRPVPGETVRALASNLAGGTLNDKDLLLNFVNLRKRGDYLVPHSLNVAILAINVGVQLGYEVERLGELGCAALLHDLGMLRLSEELLATRRRLSRKELAAVRDHPAAGLKALTSVSSYPETTPLVLYQEHERCDGSGYPEGTRGDAIHDFAKIVAVADVYDALISRRPWREAESPFKALADVLQMAESGLLDPAASRGLLEALSRFPVGSWVELTDGSVAKVVAARPDGLDRPEVAVLTSLANKSYQRVDLALEKGLSVARAVEGSERSIEHLLEGF